MLAYVLRAARTWLRRQGHTCVALEDMLYQRVHMRKQAKAMYRYGVAWRAQIERGYNTDPF